VEAGAVKKERSENVAAHEALHAAVARAVAAR